MPDRRLISTVIARTGAGNVKQMLLRSEDFFQIRTISNCLDPLQ
jgi:hypothetical protein